MQIQRLHPLQLTAIIITLVMMACGGGQKHVNLAPPATSKMIDTAPEWYQRVPTHPDSLYTRKSATSRDMQLAVDKASHEAMVELAARMQRHISGLIKNLSEEVGETQDSQILSQFTAQSKNIVDQTLVGAYIAEQAIYKESNNIYRAFVLATIPIGPANAALMEKIRGNERIYTRVRSSEAFKELEQEVEKYRRHQAEQEAKMRSLSRGQQ